MKAIILAAGRGSRLAERTKTIPKCMNKLWGRTLIDWQIDTLRQSNIHEIGIVVGYQAEKLKLDKVSIFENIHWEQTNVLKSLLSAREWLENSNCIIAYSDILYSKNIITKITKNQNDIVIPYKTNYLELWEQRFENPLIDLETFKLKEDQSLLLEIGNRTQNINEIEGQFMGLLKISAEGFNTIFKIVDLLSQDIINKLDMTGLLKILLENKIDIFTEASNEFWIEVDNVTDIELYESWDRIDFN